jgi:universal stress protein E
MELFHVIDTTVYVDLLDPPDVSLEHLQQNRRKQHLEDLERIAAGIRRTGIHVTTAVDWDYPSYESIIRRAIRTHADLIVAERHGGRHIVPWLLRMDDWELLRLSPVPVLLVKRSGRYRRPAVLAAVDPMHAFAKPANLDRQILRIGREVTKALHGKLHAMHAYVSIPDVAELWATKEGTVKIQAFAAAEARKAFERVLSSSRIPASRRHLVDRLPQNAIEEISRQIGTSILVMGAISRSGVKGAFFGNTAERILDYIDCDVLVVKPRNFVNRVSRTMRGARLSASMPSLLPGGI